MISDSLKNILNTSLNLAPMERSIPICLLLYVRLVAINVENNIIANIAKNLPMPLNTIAMLLSSSPIKDISKVIEFCIAYRVALSLFVSFIIFVINDLFFVNLEKANE